MSAQTRVAWLAALRAGLERLNPALPTKAITAAGDDLIRDRLAMSGEAANREVYLLLKEGIKVSMPESDSTPRPGPPPVEAERESEAAGRRRSGCG